MKTRGLGKICYDLMQALDKDRISAKDAKQKFAEYSGFRVSARSKEKLIHALSAYSNIRSKK
jgi:hypothetical protein|nr:MAG TPA: hypothetical protein [Caudoviricetes sp.]